MGTYVVLWQACGASCRSREQASPAHFVISGFCDFRLSEKRASLPAPCRGVGPWPETVNPKAHRRICALLQATSEHHRSTDEVVVIPLARLILEHDVQLNCSFGVLASLS